MVRDYARSVLREYLAQRFPHRRAVAEEMMARYAALPVVPGDIGSPALLGRALEHLIVLDLGGLDAYPHLDTALPADAAALVQVDPAGQVADDPARVTERMVRAAWYLAFHQDVLHKYGRTDKALCRATLAHHTATPFHGRTFTAALPVIQDLFTAYRRRARAQLRALRPVRGAVEMVPHRAYADLIAGGTLVEIKTGHVDVDDILDAVDQALEYVMLDTADTWQLTHIAIYLTRAGLLHHNPVSAWLARLSGDTATLAQHRDAITRLPHTVST